MSTGGVSMGKTAKYAILISVAVVVIIAVFLLSWKLYRRNNAAVIISEAVTDAQQMMAKHEFDSAKDLLDDTIAEFSQSNPEQIKEAETLRTKLIARYGQWIDSRNARERQKEKNETARSESIRKRRLYNYLTDAARLKDNENRLKDAEDLISQAYKLCNSDGERAEVAKVDKQVREAADKIRPWAAVADFTLDKSVKVDHLTGSAIAVKLEQALGNKFRLLTRSQVSKALQELNFQASDLADRNKAKQFGKLVGAEYLITGSVIQLGQEITVACQIFNLETGAIRQTAEVSAVSVNDFNYMIREAADILSMSNEQKRKYLEEKRNGKKAPPYVKSPYVPVKAEDRTVPGLNMPLVYVAPGSFQMGSTGKGGYQVTLTKAYWIGKNEVTQKEYHTIMGSNPSRFRSDDNPVEMVNWYDAVEFCKKLTALERQARRLPAGYEYRLPTEAEWEFAARGGTKTRNYRYSGNNNFNNVGWVRSNAGKSSHKIGTKSANELSIYDMTGNVWEWCYDLYGRYGSHVDPIGAAGGSTRVKRGGSWHERAKYGMVAVRHHNVPNQGTDNIGFRIVLGPNLKR